LGMMQTSSGKCSLCAMQPSLMDSDKMGGSRGEHNNQTETAAVETAVLGSVHNEVTTRGGGTIHDGMGMGEGGG
jgi:hypothetical protein